MVLQRNADGTEAYVHYVNTDKRLDEWRRTDELVDPSPSAFSTPASALASSSSSHTNSRSHPPTESHPRPRANGNTSNGHGRVHSHPPRHRQSLPSQRLAESSKESTTSYRTSSKRKRRTRSASSSSVASTPARQDLDQDQDQDVEMLDHDATITPLRDPSPNTHPVTDFEIDLHEHRKNTTQRNFDKVYFDRWLIKTWCVSTSPILKKIIPITHYFFNSIN